jgi:hypothetical protein
MVASNHAKQTKKFNRVHYGCKRSFSNEHAYESANSKGKIKCVHCGFETKVLGTASKDFSKMQRGYKGVASRRVI